MAVRFKVTEEQMTLAREANASPHFRPFFPGYAEHIRRRDLGFHKNFSDIEGDLGGSCLHARKIACTLSSSVVALSCNDANGLQQNCSGIIVRYNKEKKIVTSTYILGGHSEALGLQVEILFSNGSKKEGKVSFFDEEHNVAFIDGDLGSTKVAPLCSNLRLLDVDVISLGRNSHFGLMVSRGKVNIRNDVLKSDDLMSSDSKISESGIGGPLVDVSKGVVIGMNVYIQRKSSLFIPTVILRHCFQQLVHYRKVRRPCTGLKVRSIGEKKTNELELIYDKFPLTNGITVNEVISGSPAEEKGISVGDIITFCDDTQVSSPIQLADMLLGMGMAMAHHDRVTTLVTRGGKKKALTSVPKTEIKIQIQKLASGEIEDVIIDVKEFTQAVITSWPALPLETIQNQNSLL